MKFQEILSFLEDEEKRKNLIYKLKQAGEDSEPVYALEGIITSLNLHKPPRGIHEKTMLQNTFHYTNPRECFDSFRLVCKSWKNAIETIRFDQQLIVDELPANECNGHFVIFYTKYFKAFKKLKLMVTPQMLPKWGPLSDLILNSMKKMNNIAIQYLSQIPPNFDSFILQLFQNSQTTLHTFAIFGSEIMSFPNISLSNLTNFEFHVLPDHSDQIEKFDELVHCVSNNCKYIKHFRIYFVGRSPPLFKQIETNYAHKCLSSQNMDVSFKIPARMAYCGLLSHLSELKYPNKIEFLESQVLDFDLPNESGWAEYKTILALCPNLKKIRLWIKPNDTIIDYKKAFDNISEESQDIWQKRITYLNSRGIKIVGEEGWDEYIEILLKTMKWGFEFYKYN